MSTPKFSVGDRVRTVNHYNGLSSIYRDGEEFTVTEVCPRRYHTGSVPDFYYMGDPGNYGVWETRLELVESAGRVTDFASEPVGSYVERNDGWRFIKTAPNAWLPVPSDALYNDLRYTDSQMQYGLDNYNGREWYTRLAEGK